jgi:hypothetical protein
VEIKEEDDDEELISKEEATLYRGVVARGNYLTQDRSDIQFAVKELSRGMANPTKGDMRNLKRFGRYLIGKTRAITHMNYQGSMGIIDAWVDTDFAGCRKTRKSTSGGLLAIGGHVLKSWSSTQGIIALSSGEAEYYGMVKGASLGLGLKALMGDLGIDHKLRVRTDASAAKGIATRKGLGKVRHIEVNQLWLQDRVAAGEVEIMKVKGEINWADALTKHVDGDSLKRHSRYVGLNIGNDRHEIMPELGKEDSIDGDSQCELDDEE